MKRSVWVILLATFLMLPSGRPFADESKGVDGTVWKQLNADNKALFTLGYFTGIQIFAKYAPGSCSNCQADCMDEASSKLVPLGTSIPQVVQVIDSIYTDAANQVIPVQWALKLAAQKAKGMSDEEFKAAIADAVKGSAPAKPAQPPPQPAPGK
ncbi:MAG: hypothetical protein DMH00_08015 [Acidobacteria bacterium]|nr:MAG: hypothetical protein DMH00_08015 [Acidobacteriota bacterium]